MRAKPLLVLNSRLREPIPMGGSSFSEVSDPNQQVNLAMVHLLASEERENEKNLPYPRLAC